MRGRQPRFKLELPEPFALLRFARQFLPGRIEMGYSYDELAQVSGKPMPDAARKATERALVRVAGKIARASE